jgi:hypothetical protein
LDSGKKFSAGEVIRIVELAKFIRNKAINGAASRYLDIMLINFVGLTYKKLNLPTYCSHFISFKKLDIVAQL